MADITLTADQAEAIIVEALKDRFGDGPVYSGDMPESPEKRLEVANELVGFAIDAYTNDNIRGEEVTSVLDAADIHIDDSGSITQNGARPVADVDDDGPTDLEGDAHGETVVLIGPNQEEIEVPETAAGALLSAGFSRKPAPEPDPEPEPEVQDPNLVVIIGDAKVELPRAQAELLLQAGTARPVESDPDLDIPSQPDPDPDPDPDADRLEEPWEGYDSAKDTDIRRQMEEFSDEEIDYVKRYEAQNKNRKRIADFKPGKRSSQERQTDQADARQGELDAEALAAADGDTKGEEKLPEADFEPARTDEGHDHVPILTAQQERMLALAEVEKSRLPVPGDAIEDPPQFPEDIAGIDDKSLHTLHSQFNACLALANWKLGLITVDERAFKHIADSKAREVRQSLDPNNPATGKPKGREALEREAEDHHDVQVWREKQYQADLRAIPLRKLVDIYSSHVEVLSRQWTFREREINSSGQLPPRS
jgi:hypothetical protein